ncbi:inositol monophosphatase 3-like isoform X2 [Pseudomyrmex gracilis]|uniref:inositol monophosphatase 3-like isoform X2 n=1 Tax=Pseudomyrmex gracilis TaxID=219809 RepID=UPI000995368B|nr:inositol monophosphatase 3-like isoform X2 [Pseudomyrmex gracilis]
MSGDTDIARYFEFAKNLTLQAGKILKCDLLEDNTVKKLNLRNYTELVTDVDHRVENLFIDSLSKEFPDHKIIAEKTTKDEQTPELTDAPTWFIDPIDGNNESGTTNFVDTFFTSCISVGLTVRKEPVLGIVFNPSHSELYSATRGKGAFLNGKPIRTSNVTELKKAMITVEPLCPKCSTTPRDIVIGRSEALTINTQATRSPGSAALCMAYVARGKLDCFYLHGLRSWDTMAGTVILRETGGSVIDMKGCDFL